MGKLERRRRMVLAAVITLCVAASSVWAGLPIARDNKPATPAPQLTQEQKQNLASVKLDNLQVKGRAPKTGYSRAQFGAGWADAGACDVRNQILRRDLGSVAVRSVTDCTVVSGTLQDPYTDKTIAFKRGPGTSSAVQIDHVVALSDAWQKGAQQLSPQERVALANDLLNLLAVDGPANMEKSDADAATWLPPNKAYRCRYVARQIAVKLKYMLWVTAAERDAMRSVLKTCPGQVLPVVPAGNS